MAAIVFNNLLLTGLTFLWGICYTEKVVTKMAGRSEKITIICTVTEALPNAYFRVCSEGGKEIYTYLSGKMRIYRIKVLVGDRVRVELSPDGEKGRIIQRL